jgi:hypothetical protein
MTTTSYEIRQIDYALPLTTRKLANRNNDIHTRELRQLIPTENGAVNEYITAEMGKPKFLPTQCLRRVLWRISTIDNRIPKKIAYIFTLAGTATVAISSTLMYTLKDLETDTLQQMDTANDWKNFWFSFVIVLTAILTLGLLELLWNVYMVWGKSHQQLLKELRFEYAITEYTKHNPYSSEYTNLYNSANDQDPDAVILWIMDEEDKIEKRNDGCCTRLRTSIEWFFLVDFVKIKEDSDPVNKFCYKTCCCCCKGRGKKKEKTDDHVSHTQLKDIKQISYATLKTNTSNKHTYLLNAKTPPF